LKKSGATEAYFEQKIRDVDARSSRTDTVANQAFEATAKSAKKITRNLAIGLQRVSPFPHLLLLRFIIRR